MSDPIIIEVPKDIITIEMVQGKDGKAATVAVGDVSTLPAGSDATVTNTGTDTNAVLDFGIPQGAQGEQGDPGADGFSPTATVTKVGDTATITITDKNGTTTATVSDGSGGSSTWGSISGNIADQTDLQDALDAKADIIRTSASGAVVSISDGAAYPVDALSVGVEPVQDLHGYANPWPAGGGKNLCDPSELTQEYDGLVWGYYDTGILLKANTTYTLSVSSSLNINSIGIWGTDHTTQYAHKSTGINYVSYTPTQDVYACLRVYRASGLDTSDVSGSIQLESGSSATSYAPYSNICPITGWTSAKVTRCGKNLVDISIDSTTPNTTLVFDRPIAQPITISAVNNNVTVEQAVWRLTVTYKNGSVEYVGDTGYLAGAFPKTFSATASNPIVNVIYRGTKITGGSYNIQIEYGSSASPYQPYSGTSLTIDLDGTRYGGTVDVLTGVMTVDRAIVDLGTLNYSASSAATNTYYTVSLASLCKGNGALMSSMYVTGPISNDHDGVMSINSSATIVFRNTAYADAPTFKTGMSGVQLVYELATPLTVQLTPAQLSLLLGDNTLWADTGDTAVGYRADTARYIDRVVTERTRATRNLIAGEETGTKASRNYTTGQYFWRGDQLLKVTANIASGGNITSSNTTETTVGEQLKLALS